MNDSLQGFDQVSPLNFEPWVHFPVFLVFHHEHYDYRTAVDRANFIVIKNRVRWRLTSSSSRTSSYQCRRRPGWWVRVGDCGSLQYDHVRIYKYPEDTVMANCCALSFFFVGKFV